LSEEPNIAHGDRHGVRFFPLSISTSLGLFLAGFFIFPLQNLEGEEKKVIFATRSQGAGTV